MEKKSLLRFIAPIFVPPTPNGELAAELKKIAEDEAEAGVLFQIVETGGRIVKSAVQSSNPTRHIGCDDLACLLCRTGQVRGGDCHSSGVNYQVECQKCPPNQKSLYHGETARNLFTRSMRLDTNPRMKNLSCSNTRPDSMTTPQATTLPRSWEWPGTALQDE